MNKHTNGPWVAERMINPPKAKDRRCGFVINGPEQNPLPARICDLRVPEGVGGFSEGEANARLIASAPELLEALELAIKIIPTARQYFPKSMHNHGKFALEQVCAAATKAIAKAKGTP